jgi:hypothetical protein
MERVSEQEIQVNLGRKPSLPFESGAQTAKPSGLDRLLNSKGANSAKLDKLADFGMKRQG